MVRSHPWLHLKATVLLAGLAWAPSADATMHQKSGGAGATGMQGMQGGMMGQGMLQMPNMDPARGRELFASKGCVVCHSINGVGGEDAPPLDASTMSPRMNPFDFAAKMWRGAGAMIYMQQEELGEQIEFSGEELADIIAFVHHSEEQKQFSEADIPPRIKELMHHMEEEMHHMEEEEGAHHGEEGEDDEHEEGDETSN